MCHSKYDRLSPSPVRLCPPDVPPETRPWIFKIDIFIGSIYNLTKPVPSLQAFYGPFTDRWGHAVMQSPGGAFSTSRSWKEASSHHLLFHLTELRTCQNYPHRALHPREFISAGGGGPEVEDGLTLKKGNEKQIIK